MSKSAIAHLRSDPVMSGLIEPVSSRCPLCLHFYDP
jgi:hypothetical protein